MKPASDGLGEVGDRGKTTPKGSVLPALRAAAAHWIESNLSAGMRLAAGLLLAASLVAQEDLLLRGAQALAFASLAWLVQPRLRLRRTIVFLAATVAFNLLTPAGRVLLQIGGVVVTEGALMVGAGKAASLGGLLFLSRLMVDPRLRLPGTAGALISSTMTFLARLMEERVRFRLRSPVRSLDQALLAAGSAPHEAVRVRRAGSTTMMGTACAVAVLVLCGCAVVWGRLRG